MYKEYIECADPTGCGTGNEAKAWDYQVSDIVHSMYYHWVGVQSCTELWMDSSTNNMTDMFPPRVYNSSEHCKNTWKVEKRPKWVITEFWGKGIRVITMCQQAPLYIFL